MTEENERKRSIIKEIEAAASAALQAQPADDQACGKHLQKAMERLKEIFGQERKPTVKSVADDLEKLTNTFGCRDNLMPLADAMTAMHRTLVQSFVGGFVIPLVRNMAMLFRNGRYDARNKATAEACDAMYVALESKYSLAEDDELGFPCI